MKNLILFFLFFVSVVSGQTRVKFTYDSAGNQTIRAICVGCLSRTSTVNDSIATDDTISDNDLIKDEVYNNISYYPNPVKYELYVKWINDKNYLESIQLYSMSGQLMSKKLNLKKIEMTTIEFQNYPEGFYNLVLIYDNGEKKTLKIIKK